MAEGKSVYESSSSGSTHSDHKDMNTLYEKYKDKRPLSHLH